MQIIIASDVFGITPELKTAFAALHKQAIFLSPWENNTYPHTTKAEAAANFLQCNGFETYSTKIAKALDYQMLKLFDDGFQFFS